MGRTASTWRVVRWRGARTDPKDITSSPADIRPGDTVVIPTGHPGSPLHLGDLPAEASDRRATLDVGDSAHRIARAKPVLRLHPALVDAWPESPSAAAAARATLNDLDRRYEEDPDTILDEVRGILKELSTAEVDLPPHYSPSWLRDAAQELQREFPSLAELRRGVRLVGTRTLVLAGRRRLSALSHDVASFSDEDDATSSGTSRPDGRPVPLLEHLSGVEQIARRHGVGCGLPQRLTDAIACAGSLHDLGKADPRFQSMLRGGSPWLSGALLAKSAEMPASPTARESARVRRWIPPKEAATNSCPCVLRNPLRNPFPMIRPFEISYCT